MQSEYIAYLDYVELTLRKSGNNQSSHSPFRSRISHTRRVCMWANRLCNGLNNVNTEILLTSAIFHDIGYANAPKITHNVESAKLFCAYAKEQNMSTDLIAKVSECIELHSRKDLLLFPEQLTIEQILLMEADLLDEEGAMSICRCNLRSGYDSVESYEETLKKLISLYSKKSTVNPMVTDLGKLYWEKKMEFIQTYIDELQFDLQEF